MGASPKPLDIAVDTCGYSDEVSSLVKAGSSMFEGMMLPANAVGVPVTWHGVRYSSAGRGDGL